MRPAQVLDLQALMIAELSQTKPQVYLRNVVESMYTEAVTHGKDSTSAIADAPPLAPQQGEAIVGNVQALLKGAHCYHVQAEMTDLIHAASLGLSDDTPWRRELLPTEVGFAYFDKPLETQDVRGRIMKTHVLVWGPVMTDAGPATAVYAANDMNDPDQIVQDQMRVNGYTVEELRQCGRFQVFHMMFMQGEQAIGPPKVDVSEEKVQRMLAEGDIAFSADNGLRLFVAYLRMLSQTLVKMRPAELDRAAVKRARRRKLPGLVTTVTLRRVRYEGDGDQHGEVEWSHRWLVRGHWRRQHCGENHPHAEPDGEGGWVAIIWINPYIKGPEDKPLHVTNKVYDLAR